MRRGRGVAETAAQAEWRAAGVRDAGVRDAAHVPPAEGRVAGRGGWVAKGAARPEERTCRRRNTEGGGPRTVPGGDQGSISARPRAPSRLDLASTRASSCCTRRRACPKPPGAARSAEMSPEVRSRGAAVSEAPPSQTSSGQSQSRATAPPASARSTWATAYARDTLPLGSADLAEPPPLLTKEASATATQRAQPQPPSATPSLSSCGSLRRTTASGRCTPPSPRACTRPACGSNQLSQLALGI